MSSQKGSSLKPEALKNHKAPVFGTVLPGYMAAGKAALLIHPGVG